MSHTFSFIGSTRIPIVAQLRTIHAIVLFILLHMHLGLTRCKCKKEHSAIARDGVRLLHLHLRQDWLLRSGRNTSFRTTLMHSMVLDMDLKRQSYGEIDNYKRCNKLVMTHKCQRALSNNSNMAISSNSYNGIL